MIHILLEGYNCSEPWLYDSLCMYIKPFHKVAVLAFGFRDNRVQSAKDWDTLYSKENGKYYNGITGSFLAYGIPQENISFIHYFLDTPESAKEKIKESDILYFPGGRPDRMMERIREFALEDTLLHHSGIVIGYSAGAVLQLAEYHLSPDEDYPTFAYYNGLPYLRDFYLEVHYTGSEVQKESICRVLKERRKTVYATHLQSGAIVVDNGDVKLLGKVHVFEAKAQKKIHPYIAGGQQAEPRHYGGVVDIQKAECVNTRFISP